MVTSAHDQFKPSHNGRPRDPLATAGPEVRALLAPENHDLGPPRRALLPDDDLIPLPRDTETQRRRDTKDTGDTERRSDAGTQRHSRRSGTQ
jgi:hypothetical protein